MKLSNEEIKKKIENAFSNESITKISTWTQPNNEEKIDDSKIKKTFSEYSLDFISSIDKVIEKL